MSHPQAATIKHPSNIQFMSTNIVAKFESKYGTRLEPKSVERLRKMLTWNAEQVLKNPALLSPGEINREIIRVTVPSFQDYLDKNGFIPPTILAPAAPKSGPAPAPSRPTALEPRATSIAAVGGSSSNMMQDFERRQSELKPASVAPKSTTPAQRTAFQQIDDRGGPDAMGLYAQAQAAREAEAAARIAAMTSFQTANDAADIDTQTRLAAMAELAAAAAVPHTKVVAPPDRPLEFLYGMKGAADSGSADRVRMDVRPLPEPKEIVRQEHFLPPPIVAVSPPVGIAVAPAGPRFRESEHNLIVSSLDRDWYRSSESRYEFTVLFNAANGGRTAGETTAARTLAAVTGCEGDDLSCLRNDVPTGPVQANVLHRFNDVLRLELVKLIVPNESIDVVVSQTAPLDASGETSVIVKNVSALSLPHLNLALEEFNAENYGTGQHAQRAFGLVSYDKGWSLDSTTDNRGWLAMVPKYMHCRRVYHPAPLSTFQSLSIRIERPSGSLLSLLPDVFNVDSMAFGQDISGGVLGPSDSSFTTTADDGYPAYIFVVMKKWFPASAVLPGDNVRFQGYDVPTPGGSETDITEAISTEFQNWFNRAEGHYALGTAYRDASNSLIDVPNHAGYVNMVVIRNRFEDPTTGSTDRYLWGTADQEMDLRTLVRQSLASTVVCKAINASRQTEAIFKVVTRENDMGIPQLT